MLNVKQLIDYLSKLNPEALVVIHRDAANYGYGVIDSIKPGLYEETEYGNEFYVDQRLVVSPGEVKAVCIYPEDLEEPRPEPNPRNNC